MYERIIEIIVFVITELKSKKHIGDVDVNELQKRGYTSAEISTAFSWIVDRLEFSNKMVTRDSYTHQGSFRVLHDAEKELFTNDAWGELVQLNALGLISNEHIEILIERSVMMGFNEVDSHQLKSFVASTIFNTHLNTLPGSRFMLRGNETIN